MPYGNPDAQGNIGTIAYPGEAHIGEIGGRTIVVAASFSRPPNTTPYNALAAVSNSVSAPAVITFANIARIAQGSGYITKARTLTDLSSITPRLRLQLYNAAPTAINDGSAQTLLWANRLIRIGYIDFDALTTEGSGSDAAGALNTAIRLAFNCASGDRNLYGLLETRDPFTPASGQDIFIELTAELN
jgi:hypothetical protein